MLSLDVTIEVPFPKMDTGSPACFGAHFSVQSSQSPALSVL